MKNTRIREYASRNAVYLWQIAERYGIAESNFSRKLRHELPTEEQERIFKIIDEIVAEREVNS